MTSSSRAMSVVPTPAVATTTCEQQQQQQQQQQELDFIGPSSAVKDLFSLPYSLDKGVSVAVHNMNGTLLVDADVNDTVPTKRRKRPRPQSLKLTQEEDALAVVTSMLHLKDEDEEETSKKQAQTSAEELCKVDSDGISGMPSPAEQNTTTTMPPLEEPREYLSWKFRGMNLLVGSDALVCRNDETSVAIRVAEATELRALLKKQQEMVKQGQFVPDYLLQKSYADALKPRIEQQEQQQPQSYAAPDLSHVQLKTCIVPSSTTPLGGLLSQPVETTTTPSSTPICTVLDAYLDNIIAQVPQLALCLREHGFVQSVKLLKTEQIPSSLMHAITLETTTSTTIPENEPPLFSPHIMEMNAATLLKFLKANCTRDNATYLLRREAGETNIQLYDVSSVSTTRQRKWIWWLSMMSNRFALRLGQLDGDAAQKRSYRARQRSLMQTSLELLEELADMDGGAHETLCASVQEQLADTFLKNDAERPGASFPTAVNAQQPYATVSADALTKAQDYLANGICVLQPLLKSQEGRRPGAKKKQAVVVHEDSSSSSDSEDEMSLELQSISMQLFGLHHKLINVSLRLADHYLQNYFSSSAMRALRLASRHVADASTLVKDAELQSCLQRQYIWLWEHCGHFARSFAADELWRERGHACGDDVISVLRDVASSLDSVRFGSTNVALTKKSQGSVTLHSLSGVVSQCSSKEMVEATRAILDQQKQIQRDKRRVLVAACLSYSRAIEAVHKKTNVDSKKSHAALPDKAQRSVGPSEDKDSRALSMLRQRLGDACNEIGKIMLNEVRLLPSDATSKEALPDGDVAGVAEALLSSACFWFTEGLESFQNCQDLCNIALLRCNLCQCCKLHANSFSASSPKDSTHAESCLQEAADHLQMAHEALGERDSNPRTWDMVSEELAATFLVLGVRRRQTVLGSGTPTPLILQAMRLSPGKERSIVEPMERALEIYEQLGNAHQAAAVHYQLALFFSKVWTCQRDENKTREKLSAAFQHYSAAHAYFCRAPEGNEPTFVILSLDLANLYSAVSGKECLEKALSRCLSVATAFSFEAIDAALERQEKGEAEWFQKMTTLASSLEDKIFKLLVSLVKIEKESNDGDYYRERYRAGLTAKMAMKARNDEEGSPDFLSSFHELLVSIKEHQR